MLHKLLNALYPVTSLARLCGLLPIEIRASKCIQNNGTHQKTNRIKTFEIDHNNYNDNHTIDDYQHQSILWHILGPIWLISIIGSYLTQLFYYQTLKTNSTTRIFELFHEHASVLYIIFCLIIIQFKRSAIFETRVVMHEIESKLINDMKCEQMFYELIHKYSFISLFIFMAVMFYEIIIRTYICFLNPTNPNEPPPIVLGSSSSNTDPNSNGDSNTPETELMTRLIMVFLNVLTTSIGLALQINFFMFMMVLRLRFKTVNCEINKIAKITEHDDDDDDDDDDNDDSDNTTDNEDTDNDKSSDNEHENTIDRDSNNMMRLTELNDSNDHYVQDVTTTTTNRSKINNLRMLTTIRHGIYTGTGGNLDDNSFYASNKKWSSPDEYDESNKFYIRIRILADIHDKLSLQLSIVNSIYSVQLLFAIGIQFVLITATLYEEYETIDDHVNNYQVFFINLIFNLIRCAQTLMLIWICSNTCYHANRASIFIHKIVYMEESKLKREIENFSMQLLHNKVQVTAGGFFPIDFTLLYTIVGAVTTYLVILVQFHLADKEIKKKHQGAIGGSAN